MFSIETSSFLIFYKLTFPIEYYEIRERSERVEFYILEVLIMTFNKRHEFHY